MGFHTLIYVGALCRCFAKQNVLDLRRQASNLQAQLDNCSLEKNKLIGQIQTMEKEKNRKGKFDNEKIQFPWFYLNSIYSRLKAKCC